MAVYNGERYLREAVDSILNQTCKDFEFIILDDSSTDSTAAILKSYKDPRIISLQNEKNIGLTKSLNIGIAAAKGKYIARMDADDISLPSRLEEQLRFMEKNPDIVLTGSWAGLINEAGNTWGINKTTNDMVALKYSFLLGKPDFIHSSWFFRKDIIADMGGYNEIFNNAQDFELISRLLFSNKKVTNIQKELVRFRIHRNSVTFKLPQQSQDVDGRKGLRVFLSNINRYTAVSAVDFKTLYLSKTAGATTLSQLCKSLFLLKKIHCAFMKKERPNKLQAKKFVVSYRNVQKTIVLKFFHAIFKV
jgi:glycosyltransferase involved in cell wall biosynthesis